MPTLHARGVELGWSDRGSGRAVLLIHETGTGAAVWDAVGRELDAAGLRAVAYDRRGWGASTLPQGYARTTVEEQAEDAAAVLAGADAVPAALCGAGLGAIVAVKKLLGPDRVLELSGLTPTVEKVFRLTRMDSIFTRAPRFFLVFRRSGPIWRPEACGKRLAGVFGSVVGTHSARLWRASASSA